MAYRRLLGAFLMVAVLWACGEDREESAATAEELLEQGLASHGDGRLDEAMEKYREVLERDPNNKYALYNLGVIYQDRGQVDEAAEAYREALLIDGRYTSAVYNLAVLETDLNPEAAVDLYRQLLAMQPDDANVNFNLGLLLQRLGREAEGKARLDVALKLEPSLADRLPARTKAR